MHQGRGVLSKKSFSNQNQDEESLHSVSVVIVWNKYLIYLKRDDPTCRYWGECEVF